MSITQRVDIPTSYRLTINVPREVPVGPVILTFTPEEAIAPEPVKGVKLTTPITDRLAGCCAHLGDITLEQIREERLSKYLK